MPESFVNRAKDQMGAIERLLKGLPIVRGYMDKELRREADRRLRETLSSTLEAEKQRIFNIQKKLLSSGGLRYLDDVDEVVQKLQTLTDRIRHASYGYAGLFDAVKIREEQLDALHRFDVALAARVYEIQEQINKLADAASSGEGLQEAIQSINDLLTEFHRLYDQRHQAIIEPGLLESDLMPEVPDEWLSAADKYANPETASTAEDAPVEASDDSAEAGKDEDEQGGLFSRIWPGNKD
jgi:hypothetical protein